MIGLLLPSEACTSRRAGGAAAQSLFGGRYAVQGEGPESGGVRTAYGCDLITGKEVLFRSVSVDHATPALILQLEHEAETLKSISHAGIVPLLTSGIESQRFWLIHDHSNVEPLPSRIARSSLSVRDSLFLAREILTALETLQEAGLTPRSIRPETVFIEKNDLELRCRLLAIDVADPAHAMASGAVSSEQLIQLAEFLSPEQTGVSNAPFSELSNTYVVGCLLFWCLTGKPPFHGERLSDVLLNQTTRAVPTLRESGLTVPRALDEILSRTLSRDQQGRYQSISALISDIDELLLAMDLGETDPDIAVGATDYRTSLLQPAFVARTQEIEKLDSLIRDTQFGEATLSFLEGESGSGKSRLLSEFTIRAKQAGLRVFYGKAVSDRGQTPFEILDGVTADFLDQAEHLPETISRMRERLQEQRVVVAHALPKLAHVLGVSEEEKQDSGPSGESRVLSALVAFLEAMGTREAPAVVILDDSQWAADLLHRLLQRWHMLRTSTPAGGHFVQLIVAFRSEEVPAAHPLRHIQPDVHLRLGPLGDWDVKRLIESMAGPLPQPAVDTVIRLADGIPFMASAILQGLVETGALIPERRGWTINAEALAQARSSARSGEFLAERLNLLSPATRRLMSVGAILGSQFDLMMALDLAELNRIQAVEAVHDARNRRLMWCDFHQGICVFVHDRVRESLLALLSTEEKERLHLQSASYLQKNNPELVAELAYHFDAAGCYQAALPYALDAATEALSRHSLEVAEQQFSIAYRGAVEESVQVRFDIAYRLGDVLLLRGKYSFAETMLNEAATLASTRLEKAEVRGLQGELRKKRGDMEGAAEVFASALESLGSPVPGNRFRLVCSLILEVFIQILHSNFASLCCNRKGLPDRQKRLELRIYSELSHAYWYSSSLGRTMWAHLRGMNMGERYLPTLELAQSYSDHAPAMLLFSWIRRGKWYVNRSLQIRDELGDLWGQGQSLSFHGIICYAAAEYEECISKCRRAVQILERTGDFWQVHIARYQIAASFLRLGDTEAALEETRRNYTSGIMLGDEQASGIILDVWSRLTPGKLPQSILETELARERPDAQGRAQVMLAKAVHLIAIGQPRHAAEILTEAASVIEKAGVQNPYTAPVYVWLATAWRMTAETHQGLAPQERNRCLNRARRALRSAFLQSWRFKNDLPQIYRELGLIETMRGNARKAWLAFAKSLDIARKQDARVEQAVSLAARARAARDFGWNIPQVNTDLSGPAMSDRQIRNLDIAIRQSGSQPTLSLIDRFETLLQVGRVITSSLTKEAICRETESAACRLLRTDEAFLIWLDEQGLASSSSAKFKTIPPNTDPALLGQAVTRRQVVVSKPTEQSSVKDQERSSIYAPISLRGKVVACLVATQEGRRDFFGVDESRIAEFIATLAGAAFENAEGFEQLALLNTSLEQRVEERTAIVEERASLLVETNQELERVTHEVSAAREEIVAAQLEADTIHLAKSRFLADISSEIITSIDEMMETAEGALRSTSGQRQRADTSKVRQLGRELRIIVQHLVNLAETDVNAPANSFTPFNLYQAVNEVTEILSASASLKGLQLTCRIHSNVPMHVIGDPSRVRQILVNLIWNAVKLSHSDCVEVTVRLDTMDSERAQVHFEIQDTGRMIEQDHQPLDLSSEAPSHKLNPDMSEEHPGLTIAAQWTRKLKGKLWVEPDAQAGHTFHVLLPLFPLPAPDEVPPAAAGDTPSDSPAPASPEPGTIFNSLYSVVPR